MTTAANHLTAVRKAIEASPDGAAYISDPEVFDWIQDPNNRTDVLKAGFCVRKGRPGQNEFLVHSRTLTNEEIAAFVRKNANPDTAQQTTVQTRPHADTTSIDSTEKGRHSYHPPKIADDIAKILEDNLSHVIWLTGPTQCGKDKCIHYVVEDLMKRNLFQINCRGDMDSSIFLGEKTVDIDPKTAQNYVRFQRGMVEQAMTEGVEKDADGNEVLDENGRPKVIGPAGVLFIDEAAAMPAHVAIAINRLLESDDNVRTLVIDNDGGRVVKSHPDFRIVFASNTVGRGSSDLSSNLYAAQNDALDLSLLNRVAAFFKMGYDRVAEKNILRDKIPDDAEVAKLLKFRNAIRDNIRNGRLMSMFSTAHLVHIADNFRIYNDMPKAIFYTVFNSLLPEEKPVYEETITAIYGVADIEATISGNNIDYF